MHAPFKKRHRGRKGRWRRKKEEEKKNPLHLQTIEKKSLIDLQHEVERKPQ